MGAGTETPIVDSVATLRASGIMRYVGAAFLLIWLAGWVIGEAVGLAFFVMAIASLAGSAVSAPIPWAPDWGTAGVGSFVLLFGLVWLLFWTIAGFAALTHLFRSVAGEDRIRLIPGALELMRRAGPFHRTRTFDRASIRRVRLRRGDNVLVMDAANGTEVLTELGAATERATICEWMKEHLGLAAGRALGAHEAPPGWNMSFNAGDIVLARPDRRTRRIQAAIMWLVTGVVSLGWMAVPRDLGDLGGVRGGALALTALLAAGAAWPTWGRSEWIVGGGRITFRRCFAGWCRTETFDHARLEIETSTDSDGDDHFRLIVRDTDRHRMISKMMNDETEVVDFGRWLASRTGFQLKLPRDLKQAWPLI
jgi:hypothetical protein